MPVLSGRHRWRAVLRLARRFAAPRGAGGGHLEKWLSAVGGLVGLAGVMAISQASLGPAGSIGLTASMGASAVLLFAVPHGALSQPWAVFGGHLLSAVIGVACVQAISQPVLAAPLAVALAIAAMHYLRCIHPPGGATALNAVVGGEVVQQLGFQYVLTPVLLNAITIILIAWLFNYPFRWRRYPLALAAGGPAAPSSPPQAALPEDRNA